MNKGAWFVLGIVAAAGAALVSLMAGAAHGFSAREKPGVMETWLANLARGAALPSGVRTQRNPVTLTPELLNEARAHWADHCAACHANDGSGDVPMGRNMYPPAPDMRKAETQQMTDGELFYIIQNGVRLTGMPAWGGSGGHDEEDSWKLVYFIRHLPQVTVEEKQEMEKLNPKSPDDLKEEQEEEKFLKGEDSDAQQTEHHHH
jgi:mono/diheme cytochrome c family protein